MLLDDLTEEKYMELWDKLGSDNKICEVLHTSNTPLQVWKKEKGVRTMEKIQAKRKEIWDKRVKLNNELKEQGLDSHEIAEALGFGAVSSYWGWRHATRAKGYELL